MKKLIQGNNVQVIVLLLLSIAQTITLIICKPVPIGEIILIQIASLFAISFIRFAYYYAYFSNKMYSYFRRKNSGDVDDEPSEWAIISVKISGYIILILQTIFLFLF